MAAMTNGHRIVPLAIPPDTPGQNRTADKAGHRRRGDNGTAFIAVALFAVAQVAVVAFSGSWQHQYELSIHLRQAHWVAGMQPLSVEGLIVSASLVIWYAGRHGYRRREVWGAYLVLAISAGQTVLMNLGSDSPWPWLRMEISVWPAVAFVAAYEMAVWLVRKQQERKDNTARRADNPVDTVDNHAGTRTRADTGTRVDKAVDTTPGDMAAAAIRDHPALVDRRAWTELGRIAGVSPKTVQRAAKSPLT